MIVARARRSAAQAVCVSIVLIGGAAASLLAAQGAKGVLGAMLVTETDVD